MGWGWDPRGCFLCGRMCYRRIINTVPVGWSRVRSARDGAVVLLCPTCKK